MMVQNEGKRIIVLIWVLVGAGLFAGAITVALFGWHLREIQADRAFIIARGKQLAMEIAQIRELADDVHTDFDDILSLDKVSHPRKNPAEDLFRHVQNTLQVKGRKHEVIRLLQEIKVASERYKEVWAKAVNWQNEYEAVYLDFRQRRTLKEVQGLIRRLRELINTAEGKRRIQDALLYRRWRNAQGAEASRLAQTFLERQVGKETKNLDAIETELEEFARFVASLSGEEQIDNLVDIKDNELKPSLERLKRNLKTLAEYDEAFVQEGPQTLEAIYVALFGKGYTIDKTHQTVLMGQGGLYGLLHDRLRLRLERLEILKQGKFISEGFRASLNKLVHLFQKLARSVAREMEENLRFGFYQLLLMTGATAIGLITLVFIISRLIRRQVNALEEARAAEYASNQTTQRLLAEQKVSAEAIAKLHRDNKLILDSAGEGIYGIDLEGNATFVNPTGAKLLGYEVEELVGMPTHATVHHTRPDGTPYPKEECTMYAAFKDGKVHKVETDVFWRKDGTSFPVQYTSTPIWEENHVTGVVVTFQDITERKKAEAGLEEAKLTAEKANRAKSDFLASMSHELRTPLNGILGFSQILKRDSNLSEKQRSGVEVIQNCGNHLLTLINDILDLSKIEAQKLELNPIDFNLSDSLQQIVHVIKVRAEQKGLAFVCEKSNDLPPVVRGDEKYLRQVLLNLLTNAVKFTETGGVTLKVYPSENRGQDRAVYFVVQDTGKGIPEKDLEEIFLPFRQVAEHTRKEEGTGLGLAITKQLITLMGGEIQVRSTVGEGSTFSFSVKLSPVEGAVPTPIQRQQTIVGFKGSKKNILVVDDKSENRAVISGLLAPLGFDVQEAADGQECLAKAKETRPDLIIMDLLMPDMDGLEATRRIKQLLDLKDVPVIASSASVFEFNQQNAKAAGCSDFLPKPVQADTLFEELRIHLNLEWEYASDMPQANLTQKVDGPLIPPPDSDLAALFELAKVGKIMAIRQHIQKIEKLGEPFGPFVEELQRIVKKFDMDQLSQFLRQFLDQPK